MFTRSTKVLIPRKRETRLTHRPEGCRVHFQELVPLASPTIRISSQTGNVSLGVGIFCHITIFGRAIVVSPLISGLQPARERRLGPRYR